MTDVLSDLRAATGSAYPLRWVSDREDHGDYDGRERAVDVFNIEVPERAAFLKATRAVRQAARETPGGSLVFVFHTTAATREHYDLD